MARRSCKNYDCEKVAEKLAEWKEKKGYSNKEIGSMTHTSRSTISNMLMAKHVMADTLRKVCNVANIDINLYKTEEVEKDFDYELLREDVCKYIAKKGISQAKFARESCISAPTISNFVTGCHIYVKPETARRICGEIGKPYTSYIKGGSLDGCYRWIEGENMWEYRFSLCGVPYSVYGKTKEACETKAKAKKEQLLGKTSEHPAEKEDLHKLVASVVEECLSKTVEECISKTFEKFLENHLGEYKRRRRWN